MQRSARQAASRLLAQLAAKVNLSAEAMLDETIQPAPLGSQASRQRVLLTGATGYLGAFLLRELLVQTPAEIYCLVRCGGIEDGAQRIRATLESYSLWSPADAARIHPVRADLSRPLLGLSADQFDALAESIDVIYHAGALVNLVYPYTVLRPTNVSGTQEILRLATRKEARPVHFVSSMSIFMSPDYAGRVVTEDLTEPRGEGLRNGYAQSKWVAERLMAIAAHRGVPVTVYRPSFIGWHSGTGAFNDRDFVCGLLTGCLELGAAPEMDMMVDAAPVDYVSRAIVHLGSRQGSAGKVFHLHNPERIAWNDLVGLYVSLGARLKPEPYEAWLGRVEQARNSDFQERFASVLPVTSASGNSWIFDALSEARIQRFDRRNVAEALASTGIECPRWDAPLVKAHLTRLLPPG